VNFKKLWVYLSKRRKKQFWLIAILMIIASVAEILSIGAVLPFLGALTDPEFLYQHQLMQSLISFFKIESSDQLLLPLTLLFISVALLAGIVRLTLLYVVVRFSYATGADLSIDIYRRTLYQEYTTHLSRNSSEVINGIINKTSIIISGVINPALTLISSFIIMTVIITTLFTIDGTVASIASIGFGSLYWIVIRYTRQQLKGNSHCIAERSTQMIKTLQEGLGGIRDVLIDGTQQFFCQQYRSADLPLRRASGNNAFIGQSPRYIMESIGIILISGIAYTMQMQEGEIKSTIPILGALALGAQRLLPVLQQAYSSYTLIKGSESSFNDILDLLNQPLPNHAIQAQLTPISFSKEISLKNLSFRYAPNTPWVLKDINLTITKGSRIGFMGVTGSGKSTLLDIIMSLLTPTKGGVIIDSQPINVENHITWQSHIAHVPQTIYLSDGTIKENIAFGIPKEEINYDRIKEVARQAKIDQLIKGWPDGYDTVVGERGVRLSGGQRQRIGIARALYKRADVLIFDEATSALDSKTEQSVMKAIEGLEKELTILIIAHRLTTLKGCDQIVEITQGGINVGKYEEIAILK
jgi:ATP-binding cassette, subfamily B, bacterial PglK